MIWIPAKDQIADDLTKTQNSKITNLRTLKLLFACFVCIVFMSFSPALAQMYGKANRVVNNPGVAGTVGITFLIMPFLLF